MDQMPSFSGPHVRFKVALLFALLAGLLAMAPYITHIFTPGYRGLTVIRDKDYANYYSRLERVLTGHPLEAGNGITPVGSGIEGLQAAGIERIVGALTAWTGIPAVPLSVIVTGLLAPILFLLFFALLKQLQFPDRWALGITLIFFIAMFHGLTRVMHPGWSFVPSIAALLLFLLFHDRPTLPRTIAAGILLGILPYLYFWSWMFVWGSAASLALISILTNRQHAPIIKQWKHSVLLAIIVAAIIFPFFIYTALLFHNPLYPEVAIRASFLYQRTPESWPRTVLLIAQTIAFLSLFRRYRGRSSYLAVAAMLIGITLAMHQNVIHNRVLMFASHFEPHMIIASVIAGAWVLLHRAPFIRRMIIACIAFIFLAAGIWDYAFAHRFFIPQASDFRHQHLLEPIALLQNNHRDVVLTDADTGRTLTSWTDDGIIYTQHTRFLFLSDAALAERFCVTEMFNPKPDPYRALYIEYNDVLDSPEMREHEKDLVVEGCEYVQSRRPQVLKRYGVTHVLWNEKERPTWRVRRYVKELGLVERASGSGWTLWEVE